MKNNFNSIRMQSSIYRKGLQEREGILSCFLHRFIRWWASLFVCLGSYDPDNASDHVKLVNLLTLFHRPVKLLAQFQVHILLSALLGSVERREEPHKLFHDWSPGRLCSCWESNLQPLIYSQMCCHLRYGRLSGLLQWGDIFQLGFQPFQESFTLTLTLFHRWKRNNLHLPREKPHELLLT